MKIIDRIFLYIDKQGFATSRVERDLGIGNNTLGKARERGKGIGAEIVAKFVEVYPDIDLNWLITGEGSMLKHDNAQPAAGIGDLPPGPCRQCELRERLLAEKDERLAELREHLNSLRCHEHPKTKQRSA
jgi:hypothetical protein